MNKFMKEAIKEATLGIKNYEGGPFGAIIVKDGKIVGRGHNQVLKNNDATCHGEIQAIHDASKNLKTFDLSGCELYTTGEPCQMCLVASLWANIDKIFYGATILDNSLIGFRDEKFDKMFSGRKKLKNYLVNIDREDCLKLFEKYNKMKNKIIY